MPPTAEDPHFRRGIALFNAGRYFDAHEEWEHVWRTCPQSDRRFVHSLIHAAVALYQWTRGNVPAARTQLARGAAKAAACPRCYLGVDAARLWADVTAALDSPGPSVVLIHTGTQDA
jgi:predicted metal-dependent hydrolase